MSHKFKVVSILFSMDQPLSPFRIIRDIERFFKCTDSVVSLKAMGGDLFICTLSDSDVVSAVRKQNTLALNGRPCRYREVETNIISIKVSIPSDAHVSAEDINRSIRQYANVMVSYELHDENRSYFAIVDMKRDIPTKITVKNNVMCEVKEL